MREQHPLTRRSPKINRLSPFCCIIRVRVGWASPCLPSQIPEQSHSAALRCFQPLRDGSLARAMPPLKRAVQCLRWCRCCCIIWMAPGVLLPAH